ncbi:histidine--tRNA ligase [Candidatus Xianfuyuplasma coldseepsis]|uniref:Histidine--tRNA ligase n=1 Tax=Candidatus Xianfuyuplasma coldseepsis TaxID=2782163 RepID=A0A7L7KVV7_9MOLU|nr:histidine--tRNA ligase [Xianfuyuplasma coldseepsis]QMS85888.1 histidine--tRNA ligase [Xianfuyuplasma coldseepsis]
MYQKMKGTYDVLPTESGKWHALEKAIRNVSKLYNYKEIRTPIIEYTELFHRSVGESTDIVSKETYDFIDRGKRSNTLRPEGTAGVVRSYIENKLYADKLPVQKVYYVGPMFRYERPQKGRYRQFMQFGAEAFGSSSPQLDAEIIAYAVSVLKALKIKDVTVRLNSLGDHDSKAAYKDALMVHLKPSITELCHDCQTRYETNPLRILDCKIDNNHPVLVEAPKPMDYLTEEDANHFDAVCDYLDAMNIDYVIDKNLVRGLDYYTHTVFEVEAHLETLGAQNVICGGGRYDHLVKSLGGPEVPGVGFAFGLERLLFALESIQFKGDPQYLHLFLMILGEEQKADGMAMLNRCRLGGLFADIDFMDRGMKGKWKQVEHHNARFVAIYGANEKANNKINIKDQQSGEEVTISKHQLYNHIVAELMKPSHACTSCEADSCDDCEE